MLDTAHLTLRRWAMLVELSVINQRYQRPPIRCPSVPDPIRST
jgi:hypothetical protein